MSISTYDQLEFWSAARTFVSGMGIEAISLGEPEDEVWPKIRDAMAANGTPLHAGLDQGEIVRRVTKAINDGGWDVSDPSAFSSGFSGGFE